MEEPDENIGVETAEPMDPDGGEPATRAERFVDRLGERYWQTAYGGRDAFECLVRTVLSQST
ncbi:MAG: endonuclease III, partial [Halobaculum sp.]